MFRLEKNFLLREPPTSKGKNFWHQIWLDTCSHWNKFFVQGTPLLVKGNIFDNRFGLIHLQTGKNIFVKGTPSPFSKGKHFWHQIWLDTCSDWKRNFCRGTPPPLKGKFLIPDLAWYMFRLEIKFFVETPPVKGSIFDTRFGLIHVQTGKKNFVEGPPLHH